MIIPGSSYRNFAFGSAPGDVLKDEEGMVISALWAKIWRG